ncbi:hypothetical protein INF35_05925 [Subdoligranulum sp. DSM 109015]|uniref:Uncharacterized protein n=1 Tax=Gemmiger gallinarum TaxID=2779354 RepID=A0ABR9R2G1_9FIRM|nr:hypothetical protein [Gemmiger gallinarum]MBE5037313.1 hypothetical protein [Gemmiger gallinarum]
MDIVVFFVVGFLAYLLGVFGFAQIIGSLQNVKRRGIGMTLYTICVWVIILGIGWFIRYSVVPDQSFAYYLGTGISFVQILFSGKIQ